MPDKQFESNFAMLAENILTETLPSLIDFRIGFQLLDKNEEDTRAVGVTGISLNGILMYVPVFFVDSKIKMPEIWLKERDLFIPAMDNWVQVLKNKGVSVLGDLQNIHSETDVGRRPEAIRILQADELTTTGKLACYNASDANNIITEADALKMLTRGAVVDLGLAAMLPRLGKEAAETFAHAVVKYPDFTNALLQFYTPAELMAIGNLCKEAAESTPGVAGGTWPKTVIIESIDDVEVKSLTNEEKKLFLSHGVYVRDGRKATTTVFRPQIDETKIENPPATSGWYDVLMLNGEFKRFYIIHGFSRVPGANTMTIGHSGNAGDHSGPEGVNASQLWLIPPNGDRGFKVNSCDVFARPCEEQGQDILKLGTPATRIGLVRRFVNASKRNGMDSSPESPISIYGDCLIYNGDQDYQPVHFCGSMTRDSKGKSNDILKCEIRDTTKGTSQDGVFRRKLTEDGPSVYSLEFTGKPGRITVLGTTITVPSTARLFLAEDRWGEHRPELGNMTTVQGKLFKYAGLKPMRVFGSGTMMEVQSAHVQTTGMIPKTAAVRHLVDVEGISGQDAIAIMKESLRSGHQEYLLKYAGEYDPMIGAVKNKPLGRSSVRYESQPVEDRNNVVGGRPLAPPQAIQSAINSASTGNKKVFDVSVLQAMADMADITDVRKSILTDMIQGMDADGRMLYVYYWHGDLLEDQYGKEDMKALEQKLLESFKINGDKILYLMNRPSSSGNKPLLSGLLSDDIGVV